MKSIAYRFMLSAASVLTASVLLTTGISVMSGQDRLTANVPFSFEAGQTTLAAGDYNIAPNSRAMKGVVQVYNVEKGHNILMLAQNPIYESNDNRPRIVFRCASDECAISKVFYGSDGWQFAVPELSPKDKNRTAVVYFNRASVNN